MQCGYSRSSGSIVAFSARVDIPELLHPLEELEVVLHFALDELFHGDGLVVSAVSGLIVLQSFAVALAPGPRLTPCLPVCVSRRVNEQRAELHVAWQSKTQRTLSTPLFLKDFCKILKLSKYS